MTKNLIELFTGSKDNTKVAEILDKLIWASWGVYFFILATGLFYKKGALIQIAFIGGALLIIPLVLVRRSHLQLGSLITTLIVLGTVTSLAIVGNGIRDLVIVSFPVVIIIAGLTLNRNMFGICVGITMLAASGLVVAENNGWFVPEPFIGTYSNVFYLLAIIISLVIASIAVDLLTMNVRRNLEQAQQEIIERKLVEEEIYKSEKRFLSLIKYGRDNISLLTADGTLLWENPSATSTLGYDMNQFVGHNIFELIHPEDQEWARNMFIQVSQMPGKNLEGETRLMHSDGTWRWIECSATNLLDEPSVLAIVLNYRDITKRKAAEEALQNAHERQESIIEGTGVATWEWNVQTGETVFNEKWAQLIGYTLDELAPVSIRTWETYTHPDDLKRSSKLIEQHFAGELPYYECECQMKHKDGHWIWIQDSGRLMSRTTDGKPLMMFGTHTDITNRKLAEETVRESETRYKNLFENSPVSLWEEDYSQVVNGIDKLGLIGDFLRQYLEDHPDIVISLMSMIVINDVNKATLQLYSYEDKHLLIDNSPNLFKNVSHDTLVDELMAMSTRQTSYEIIVDNSRADGKVINVRVRWSVYPGHEADMSKVIVNTTDITQQIQAISVQSAIYRISQAASATENLQELYNSIHQILGELMPAKNFYIALYDGNEGMISFPYHVDEYDPHPEPRKFGNGWTEYVIRTGQPVLLSPENLDKLEEDEGVRTVGSDSIDWLGVPLKVEDRIIGMVAVQTYTEGIRYTEVEKDILVFVSNQIAMAIDRKRIEETLKYSSTHEPLTGLFNRGYYEEEIKRLSAGRQFPVGVIMMDIDDLKKINDKYGHAAGDELLKSFASVLQKEFRSNDVVARIGGDEFSVLLPLSPMKIVKKAVERTQKSVDLFNELNPNIHLSYSVGYFTTESGDSVLDAIKYADALMYHDKTSKKAARLV